MQQAVLGTVNGLPVSNQFKTFVTVNVSDTNFEFMTDDHNESRFDKVDGNILVYGEPFCAAFLQQQDNPLSVWAGQSTGYLKDVHGQVANEELKSKSIWSKQSGNVCVLRISINFGRFQVRQ
jgi:hypothetical protein